MNIALFLYFIFALAILNTNSLCCNNYTKKLGGAFQTMGIQPTSLAFTGEARFLTGTANLQITLRYFDQLFNDSLYWGLVKEDGKEQNSTCLDLEVWSFSDQYYNKGKTIENFVFNHSDDQKNQWRYLIFTFEGGYINRSLSFSQNNCQYIQNKYFAIAFKQDKQIEYIFYFEFAFTTDKSSNQAISAVFHPYNIFETAYCMPSQMCGVILSSKLQWCNDATCTSNQFYGLYFGQKFYLQQVVSISQFERYYLINTTVYYVADGLHKPTTPVLIDNTVPGRVLLLLVADITWSNVQIIVTSYLSPNIYGTGRTYDPVSGKSETIQCIKFQDQACATCDQQCLTNQGIASSSCPLCSILSFAEIKVVLPILLLLIF